MVSIKDIHGLEMPYTAKYVMEHYCKVGRMTDAIYVGVAGPEKMEFCELKET